MKNSYDVRFVDTKTNAEENLDAAEYMVGLAKKVSEIMVDAADCQSNATVSMAGAAEVIRYLLEEAEDCIALTLKEIRKLDPPREMTDQEAAEVMEKRWKHRGAIPEV